MDEIVCTTESTIWQVVTTFKKRVPQECVIIQLVVHLGRLNKSCLQKCLSIPQTAKNAEQGRRLVHTPHARAQQIRLRAPQARCTRLV